MCTVANVTVDGERDCPAKSVHREYSCVMVLVLYQGGNNANHWNKISEKQQPAKLYTDGHQYAWLDEDVRKYRIFHMK